MMRAWIRDAVVTTAARLGYKVALERTQRGRKVSIEKKKPLYSFLNAYVHEQHWNRDLSKIRPQIELLKKLSKEVKSHSQATAGKRFLCFLWTNNFTFERSLLVYYRLLMLGAEVDYLIYDGENIGHLFGLGNITRPEADFDYCREIGRIYRENLPGKINFVSDLVEKLVIQYISDEVGKLGHEACLRYAYKGLPLGEQVYPHVINFLQACTYPYSDTALQIYRNMLIVNAIMVEALSQLLPQQKYDAINVDCGVGPINAVLQMGKRHGITVNTSETTAGAIIPSVIWNKDDIALGFKVFENCEELERYDFNEKKQLLYRQNIEDRKNNKSRRVQVCNRERSSDINYLKKAIGYNDGDAVFLLLPNVPWEGMAPYENKIFANQYEWIVETIRFMERRKDYKLIIREHPGETNTGVFKPTQERLEPYLRKYYHMLPKNVFLLRSEDDVNTYALCNITTVALVYGTTMAIELIENEVPVVAVSTRHYTTMEFIHAPQGKEEYFKLIENTTSLKVTEHEKKLVRKYAYKWFFERLYPYGKEEVGVIRSVADLVSNKVITNIAETILSNKPFEYNGWLKD